MTHFALLWKARVIEKYRLEYEEEKIHSVLLSNVDIPKRTTMQKWSHYSWNTKQRLIKKIKKLYPEGSSLSNFLVYLTTDQTFPNFLMKSVIGFIGGIILTYLCFMFFVFQLSISLIHATIMSSIIGVLLTLGLAFSYRVRCLVFLLVPQFFSRVGRYTLTCYALVLILTGPATNTLKNSEVLSESMACSQEQIKANVKHLTDSIKNPFNAMKDWIRVMTERIKGIAKKTKSMLVTTHRMVIGIASVLESSFPWLNSITNKCNEKLGTPFQHCTRLLNKQRIEMPYKKHSNSKLSWFCNATYLTNFACRSLKSSRRICEIADYTRSTIVATMKRKFKTFASRIQSLFYVKIHVHHSYSFSSNASKSASQVAAGIVTEIRNRADPLLTWLSWSSCVTSLFLLLIIFRAKYYQHMYETRSRFDNRYITKELRNLDFQRLKEGKETVLPLNKREKAKYITTTSFRLLESERVYLTRSVVFMIITTFKLLIHMVADYSLYWVLMTIRYHGRFQTPLQPGPTHAGLQISGTGPIAELLRSLIGYLTLPLSTPRTSTISCLPNPYPPDLQRYTQIGVLILLMWFFALFEPYGLRLRHVVMGHYRPERDKARALWLYNHILRTRGGFMKFARRKLHRECKYLKGDDLTFVQWLDSRLPFWWLRYLLGTLPKNPICLLCDIEEEPNNVVAKLVRCDTPKCPGVYCTNCFNDLGQLCTICLSPVDYGDLSDVSLEKGSSEDSNGDSQDFNEHIESEDDEYSKQIQNFFGKRENTSSRFTSLPKRQPDTNNQWLLFHTKNSYLEEELPILKCIDDDNLISVTQNGFYRKANMVRHLKHANYDKELFKMKYKITPLGTHDRRENNPHTCPYCHEKIHDESFEIEFENTKDTVSQKLQSIRRIFSHCFKKDIKEIYYDLKRRYSESAGSGGNFKYKRKCKIRARSISGKGLRHNVSADYLSKKINKMRFRKVNVSSENLRLGVPSRLKFKTRKNLLRYLFIPLVKIKDKTKCIRSNYYSIEFNTSSIGISKIVDPNDYAKDLRKKYKMIFRCRSNNHRKNITQAFANKINSCGYHNYLFQPENVSSYCKSFCFKKSSKASNSNPRRSFDDGKRSEKSQKEPSKNDTLKNVDSKESSEAGNGDKPSEDKLDNRSTCYCMKHIRRLCFCRYADMNFGPCSLFRKMFGKSKSSLSNTINHKRRKKDKSDDGLIVSKKSPLKQKTDDETARIYRISAYIGQQEWMKGELSKSSKTDSKKRKFSTKSIDSLHKLKLKTGSKKINGTGKQIQYGQKKETPRNIANGDDDDHNGLNRDLLKKQAAKINDNKVKLQSMNTHKWFDNYYSTIPTTSTFSLKTIMKPKKAANTISTDYDISKSLRYYCSIGNTEFDQIDDPDENSNAVVNKDFKNNETLLLPLRAESEHSPLHICCCSRFEKPFEGSNMKLFTNENPGTSSVTFNFQTEFDLLSKPVRNIKLKSVKRAMSDRFLQLRVRNPLPLVRDFYSNLLDSRMRRTYDKSKGVQDGKSKAVAAYPRRKSATCQCEEECHEQTEEGNDCQPQEFSISVYEKSKAPTLDCACDTGEFVLQPQYKRTQKETTEQQNTTPLNQSGVEASPTIQRREFAINTQTTLDKNNSPIHITLRKMDYTSFKKPIVKFSF